MMSYFICTDPYYSCVSITLSPSLQLITGCTQTANTVASWRAESSPGPQLFQRFRTVEQIYTLKLICNTLLTLAHPWYFGCSQD